MLHGSTWDENRADGPLSRSTLQFFEDNRRLLQSTTDAVSWAFALLLGWALRIDFDLGLIQWGRLVVAIAVAIVLQLAVGSLEGLYTGRHSFGSFEEVAGLGRTLVVVISLGSTLNAVLPDRIPHSVPLIAGTLALLAMAGTRYGWRLALEHSKRPSEDGVLHLVEQVDVGDRDHRLVGEGFDGLDLARGERPEIGIAQRDDADDLALADERYIQKRARTPASGRAVA